MPLNSGPTQLLPYSQHFDNGYIAYRHPSFKKVFHEMMVQLPLEKGDGLFFNPALFHAAGENTTKDFKRSANLLQISACWGKPMESVDRRKILEVIWPVLSDSRRELGEDRVKALLKMVADGYSFPTNLDKDPPPAGGVSLVCLSVSELEADGTQHCPETQLDIVSRGEKEGWSQVELRTSLAALDERRLP
jgi:hypothetical protein